MQSKFIVMNRLGSTSLGHLEMGDSSWACVVLDEAVLGKLQLIAGQLARKLDLLEGYRTVVNSGAVAGAICLSFALVRSRRTAVSLAPGLM